MGAGLCVGIGGVRVDRAVATQILEAVSECAVEAALRAAAQARRVDDDLRLALERELEEARYEASLTPHAATKRWTRASGSLRVNWRPDGMQRLSASPKLRGALPAWTLALQRGRRSIKRL